MTSTAEERKMCLEKQKSFAGKPIKEERKKVKVNIIL